MGQAMVQGEGLCLPSADPEEGGSRRAEQGHGGSRCWGAVGCLGCMSLAGIWASGTGVQQVL